MVFLFKIPSIIIKSMYPNVIHNRHPEKQTVPHSLRRDYQQSDAHGLTFWSVTSKMLPPKKGGDQHTKEIAHLKKQHHLLFHNFRFALRVCITTSWSFTMQIFSNSTRSFLCKCLQMHNEAQRIKKYALFVPQSREGMFAQIDSGHHLGGKCLVLQQIA